MKRSEINHHIIESTAFFKKMNFKLPPWAFWSPWEWKNKSDSCSEVIDNMLGWDLTDFGSNDFSKRGLILFTIRNGNFDKDRKPYAEKIMIVDELQETPMHFHWSKMEDIINRGGGNLVIELCNSDREENFSNQPFTVKIDGIVRHFKPHDKAILTPGESICLEPGVYHRFYGEPNKGKVLVGEVSAVNDDSNDNCFNPSVGRFPKIIEDEVPVLLLASDYKNYIH